MFPIQTDKENPSGPSLSDTLMCKGKRYSHSIVSIRNSMTAKCGHTLKGNVNQKRGIQWLKSTDSQETSCNEHARSSTIFEKNLSSGLRENRLSEEAGKPLPKIILRSIDPQLPKHIIIE